MTGPTAEHDEDDLRRRLYREDATADDLARYAAAVRARDPAEERPEPGPAARRGPLRRVAVVVGVLAVVLVGGAIASVAFPRAAPPPAPRVVAAGDTDAFDPTSWRLPTHLHTTVTARTRAFTGRGSGTVPIDPTGLSYDGGRITVTMISATTAHVSWRVGRIETRKDWSSYPAVLAERSAVQNEGVPIPVTFDYTGTPPMSVQVGAAPAVRWGLLIEFAR